MNTPDKSRPRHPNPPIRKVEELASATECTGLTPAAVQTPGEAESYADLYAIHRQKTAWANGGLGASEEETYPHEADEV